MRTTFKVYERLKREQHINTLFLTGKAFSVFPIRIIYNITKVQDPLAASPHTAEAPLIVHPVSLSRLQVGFSVPKKKFRSSVHRHRVRRLMFEAWRLHKAALTQAIPPGSTMHVFLVFTGKELPKYPVVEKAVTTALEKLNSIVTTPA